jgi:DNA invertase Pin-like site-specific DNA recombinase
MDFDSRTPMGRFVFAMMAAFSQFERDVINERTAHGLAKARERGITGGATPQWTDKQIATAVAKHGTYEKAATALKCSLITVKRRMAKINAAKKEAGSK